MRFDKKLTIRVKESVYSDFAETSKNVHGKEPTTLIRELMEAVSDGRVKITPTEEQRKKINQLTGLYYVN